MQSATPSEAVVAVVSKGDPRMIEFEDRTGLHFPADAEGRYAGYYPRTSEEAIAHLEAARNDGAEFLCLPATAFWWLEHYSGFAAWLGVHCRVTAEDGNTCIVYDLLRSPQGVSPGGAGGDPTQQLQSLLEAILPEDALLFTIGVGGEGLSSPGRTVAALGRGNATGLRRRLEGTTRPSFVLVSKRESDPPPDSALDSVLNSKARLVASREGLGDLYEVEPPANAAKLSQSSRDEDQTPRSNSSLDGVEADKLSKRLERLGLAGQDGLSPGSSREVRE